MSKLSALTEPFGTGGNSVHPFDVDKVRADFPILSREVYGKPLVFLTQEPVPKSREWSLTVSARPMNPIIPMCIGAHTI